MRARPRGFVKTQRQIELFECIPQGLVIGVVPRFAVDDVGTNENRLEAQFLDRTVGFFHGVADVVHRHHAGAEHPRGIGLAEVVEPIVIRARDGVCEAGIHVRLGQREQPAAREHDRRIEPFSVHRFELHVRRPAAPRVVGIQLLIALVVPAANRERHRALRVGRIAQPQVADVLARYADRRLRPVLRRNKALPEIRRLHDVHIAVKNAKTMLSHRPRPFWVSGAPP